jgi:hypothetical protein
MDESLKAWLRTSPKAASAFDLMCMAWEASARLERERSNKLADALQELLADTQHAQHPSCEDGGYCPVRDAREALEEFAAIRARSQEGMSDN